VQILSPISVTAALVDGTSRLPSYPPSLASLQHPMDTSPAGHVHQPHASVWASGCRAEEAAVTVGVPPITSSLSAAMDRRERQFWTVVAYLQKWRDIMSNGTAMRSEDFGDGDAVDCFTSCGPLPSSWSACPPRAAADIMWGQRYRRR
jgi:hypothetical protein